MPLTISHVAAVLPVRRLPIVLSAFVVGTMAPDFEYFVRLAPQSRWSHHLPGVFLLTLPVALLVLWVYHRWMKAPAIALLPEAVQQRLPANVADFDFASRPVATVLSVLGGIATHIVWDMFTHMDTPIYKRWSWMQGTIVVPVIGPLAGFKVMQFGSTIAGLVALLAWLVIWYRRTTPGAASDGASQMSGIEKVGIVSVLLAITGAAALARSLLYAGMPLSRGTLIKFLGVGFATAVTVLWLQMLIFGFIWRARHGDAVAKT